jgi:serine/threonine-protein kinase
MGTVWVARNVATEADVAVKLLLQDRAESPEASARFRREAHAAAQLSHRGIVRVFDLIELSGADEGSLVMVMELLRGQTLADLIDRRTKLSVDETLEIMVPLLSALAHAHSAGIVHRDLKPENIFLAVDPDGHVTPKVLDFGISKLSSPKAPRITSDGAMLGTPSYMSPEQARGSTLVDARGDVFAVGILLYELLSGKNPFASESYHSVVAAILERDPAPLPNVPEKLWAVIEKALRKKPDERFKDASELGQALRDAMGMRPPMASASSEIAAVDVQFRLASVSASTTPPPSTMDGKRSDDGIPGLRSSARWPVLGGAIGLVGVAVLVFAFVRARSDTPGPTAPLTSESVESPQLGVLGEAARDEDATPMQGPTAEAPAGESIEVLPASEPAPSLAPHATKTTAAPPPHRDPRGARDLGGRTRPPAKEDTRPAGPNPSLARDPGF